MMKDKQVILHVGMHKTGTTYLQKEIFPHLQGVYYCPQDFGPAFDLRIQSNFLNPLEYNVTEEIGKLLRHLEEVPQDRILISHEDWFGRLPQSYINNFHNTNVLKQAFPNAKIFMSIRRQDKWYGSVYKQMLKMGQGYHIKEFLSFHDGGFRKPYPWSPSIDTYLDFSMFVLNYMRLFGEDNVLVLPYELLKQEPLQYLKRFYEFAELEPYYPSHNVYHNKEYSLISSYVALAVNNLMWTNKCKHPRLDNVLRRYIDRFLYIPHQFMGKDMQAKLLEQHCSKNQQLEALIGYDLKQYGYYS